MNYWFTADTHFGHANIIKYCNRPFKTLEEMDETLIRNWNARVKEDDVVIFIGDFCFHNSKGGKIGEGTTKIASYYLSKLKGQKVFIRGNHDHTNSLKTHITSLILDMGGMDILCVHDPEDVKGHFRLALVGNIHELWKTQKKGGTVMVNVGVDVNNFMPISFQEILNIMQNNKGD